MAEDIQRRLQRLGLKRGARHLKPVRDDKSEDAWRSGHEHEVSSKPVDSDEHRLEQLLPNGQLLSNEFGACFVIDVVYPLVYQHGDDTLSDFTVSPLTSAADIYNDSRLQSMAAEEFVFIDTETTGLSGAGTLAFMVGTAFVEGEALVVRQYFMRDHADEPAMLQELARLLDDRTGVITFNGRSFDLPLLENRYFMNQMDFLTEDLRQRPHLDLLLPSRRLWRRRLGSCSLGSLERKLMLVRRTEEDVPGWAIPGIYMDYLRTGDAREIARVFYHNHVDMLSMVVLASKILRLFSEPTAVDHPLDLFSLGRWQVSLGDVLGAERNIKMALKGLKMHELLPEEGLEMRQDLGYLLRRAERRDEAVSEWLKIAEDDFAGPQAAIVLSAYLELAKHYEWHQVDLHEALSWTRKAQTLVVQMAPQLAGEEAAIIHRLQRLDRKLASGLDS